MKFIREILTREIVCFIPVTITWKEGGESNANYVLTKTWLGSRSWYLIGSLFPCDDDDHPRFRHVLNWVHKGVIPDCAIDLK